MQPSRPAKPASRGVAIRDLKRFTGVWQERYQSHIDPVGTWFTDKTRVQVMRRRELTFENFDCAKVHRYQATGELHGKRQITGRWDETATGANAGGTFHLYADPFGRWLYGVCTGHSEKEMI